MKTKELISVWSKASSIGIAEETTDSEKVKIKLINQLALVTLLTSIIFFAVHIIVDSRNIIDDFMSGGITLLVLSLQYFGKINTARAIACFIFPLSIGIMVFLSNREFGQSNIYLLCCIMAFILYDGQNYLKALSIGFIFIIGVTTSIYLIEYAPITETGANYSYDRIIMYIGTTIISFLLVFFYQANIRTIEKEKLNLIDELEINNKELKKLNTELDQFTYTASHDLKSPLRNIVSFSNLIQLKLKKGNYQEIPENLDYILKSAKQMNHLIEDVLRFSQIEHDKEMTDVQVDLMEVLKNVKQNLHQELQEKNAKIFCDYLPSYNGNFSKLSLVFQNLIQNGVKYNISKTPMIKIWVEKMNNSICLFFKDNGIGIQEAYNDQIFEFFKRLHNSKHYQGTGIGLGLCRKIVTQMEGEIMVDSSDSNGTTFKIVLPLQSPINVKQKLLIAENLN